MLLMDKDFPELILCQTNFVEVSEMGHLTVRQISQMEVFVKFYQFGPYPCVFLGPGKECHGNLLLQAPLELRL